MRRIICLLGVLLVCGTLVCPAFAAANTFVPSISYKDGPDIEEAVLDGENVGGCVVVSSITDAKNKTTDISQEERDTLLDVYEQLSDGSMKLPCENDDYVIRELVDVSFRKTACVDAEHDHKEELAKAGTTITIDFDLGVAKTTEVVVMTYIDGEWAPIESVENNGDGTITCVFEQLCPVAFCVEADAEDAPPKTGDAAGKDLIFWGTLMAVSAAAVVVLPVCRRKYAR